MASSYICIFEKVNFMRVSMPRIEPISIDPHYSPAFYAELWGVSTDTVVRWFQDEVGVLKHGNPVKNGRRSRVALSIPYSVAQRIYEKRSS